jgi:hypothetical protein
MADNRFFPWFELEFEEFGQKKQATDLAAVTAKLKSLVPINRNFYEADIKVEMHYELVPNTFEITIAGLSSMFYDTIEVDKTAVKITLGYYKGEKPSLVLEGVVQKKEITVGECFYETKLSGIEKAWYVLETKCVEVGKDGIRKEKDLDVLTVLQDLKNKVTQDTKNNIPGVDYHLANTTLSKETQLDGHMSFDKRSALFVLKQLHELVRQLDGYSLHVRDDIIWYGKDDGDQNNAGNVIKTPEEYTFDNYLISAEPLEEDLNGLSSDCKQKDEKSIPDGYTFEILGDPNLRPGDTVKFRVEKDKKVLHPSLTIQSITHDFSRTKGYLCTGRALSQSIFLKSVFRSQASSAEAVGDELNNLLNRDKDRKPAVHVGDITSYQPGKPASDSEAGRHVADTTIDLEFHPTMTSPSIQAKLGADGVPLRERPIVSPFAWNNCGLVVPIYKGMRAVSVHNQYLREDALLSGFLWTVEMTPPPSEVGDYWLCLPLDVPSDPKQAPTTSDKAANDLITADGKRVIQLKGLRITIGDGLLENLGTRPSNVGNDNELQIEHSSGAKITMMDKQIKLEAGGRTVDISGGTVNIT